jgi:DNA mismatch endonuclease (patch repair protein)
MRATPQRDTESERRLGALLRERGLRYQQDVAPVKELRRRADFVFRGPHVAVFIDGCFWHGCPEHMTWPRHNAAWWREKIRRNQDRDRETDSHLRAAGWTVVRVWEHAVGKEAAERIVKLASANPKVVSAHRLREPRRKDKS